jgi:predicted pyridoxine 5'-phosphate oxidase superfamily flavin-nucleotide-binding protein
MSNLYGDFHRDLQDANDVRKLADIVQHAVVREEIGAPEKAFLESRDMFFLSTIDDRGRPTVSYKGGDPGFVKVIDEKTIAFPSYDGNSMYLSMGNINGNSNVGLLFVDFENPHRVRVQGHASIQKDDSLLAEYTEAEMIVRVQVTEIFKNCPRYVHNYQKIDSSPYVPREQIETPLPDWKRLDLLQDSLPAKVSEKVEQQGGTLTREELGALEQRDD